MKDLKKVFLFTLPIAVSYIFLGLTFGVIFASKGGTPLESFFIALTTFAGAAQFYALEIYGSNYQLMTFFLAVFFINLRHIGYGVAIGKNFGSWGFKKVYMIFALTDENFGMWQLSENKNLSYMVKVFFLNHCYWILGCTIGVIWGSQLKVRGLDFILTALFIVLLVDNVLKLSKERRIA